MLKSLVRQVAITGGLEAANLMQGIGLMEGARGRGAIFTLHHVRPFNPGKAAFNRHLEVTPHFLDAAIRQLRADGYQFVALKDLPGLLAKPDEGERYAVFTLDDAYRDNVEYALPVFERHEVPFTVFVCKGFCERTHSLWWETLEALFNASEAIDFDCGDGVRRLALSGTAECRTASLAIGEAIVRPGEAEAIARLDAIAAGHGVDARALCEHLVMGPRELKDLARHPLATLGAHTVSHRALGFLEAGEVAREMQESADYVRSLCGKAPTTFAYPYGDRRSVTAETARVAAEAGFTISVTTAPGTLNASSLAEPQRLPRISLNGLFQQKRYVAALASGIPFRLLARGG